MGGVLDGKLRFRGQQRKVRQRSLFLPAFPGSSAGKNLPAMQETWARSLGQEDPLEEEMTTHSSILA